MANQHPISPPSELVQQWMAEPEYSPDWNGKCMLISLTDHRLNRILAKTAQWAWNQREPEIQAAADREREEICHWLRTGPYGASIACHAEHMISDLQDARRPKPPSLKEQALESLHHLEAGCLPNIDLLRRALEAMPNE
jgi:hypothetical protein